MVKIKEEFSYLQLCSDFLSVVTISLCFILKIPQIINIIRYKGTTGINLIGLLMELFSYTVMFSYNFRSGYALLTYLEYPIILAQQLILILCVLYYKDAINFYSFIGSGAYFGFAFAFITGIVPRELLIFLVPLCTPIGASSKVVQLAEILRSKNSECVSVLTWLISSFTNFTRVFTICLDSADVSLLLNFIVSTLLSTSVMIAAYYYKPKDLHSKTQ